MNLLLTVAISLSAFTDYEVVAAEDNEEEEIKQQIVDENAECAFVIKS